MQIIRKVILMMAAVLLITGCGGSTAPDIQEVLQGTQENENTQNIVSNTQENDSTQAANDAVSGGEEDNTICVFVCGEVVSPGVYYFMDGARKADAVEAAGGFTESANTSYVNLAELLTDEMQLYIPALKGETDDAGAGVSATETEAAHAGKINLNTATVQELCQLSGIGESKAEAILQYREEHGGFETVDDLIQVSGIGESTLEKIRDYIYVE